VAYLAVPDKYTSYKIKIKCKLIKSITIKQCKGVIAMEIDSNENI
jgi:hypothetical protein